LANKQFVVGNLLETFYSFLQLTNDTHRRDELLSTERFLSDRAVFYGHGQKLVATHYNVPHIEYVRTLPGYEQTEIIYPDFQIQESLSCEFLASDAFCRRLEAFAGGEPVEVITYAPTWQLATVIGALQSSFDLRSAECGTLQHAQLRDYLDSKVGFRSTLAAVSRKPRMRVPHAFIVNSLEEILRAGQWFEARGLRRLLKANTGESGLGNLELKTVTEAYIREYFDYIDDQPMLVEEFIESGNGPISPSVEMHVPPIGQGRPRLAYLSMQHFVEDGEFAGVVIDAEQLAAYPWAEDFIDFGLAVAQIFQQMGYVGFFDIDGIVDREGYLYPIEANARRTGGTHVHEFALNTYGENYVSKVYSLSNDSVPTGITEYAELMERIKPLLYPINGQRLGIIPTLTSSLQQGSTGFMLFHEDRDKGLALYDAYLNAVG